MTRLEIVLPVAPICSLVVAPLLLGQCLVTPTLYSMVTEKSGQRTVMSLGIERPTTLCELA
jgi:hypothetical protein